MEKLVKTDDILTTYNYKDGFMVDIIEKDNIYEAFLCHKDYGIKILMLERPRTLQSLPQFIEAVENSINEHIEGYIKKYMI